MLSQPWFDVFDKAKDLLYAACEKLDGTQSYGSVSVSINVNGSKGPSRPVAEVKTTYITGDLARQRPD